MDPALLTLLAPAVFGAALLQSATGIGYGVIAGPIFLVALNGPEAVQISTLHNFLIAIMLVPTLRHRVRTEPLFLLCLGGAAGIAVGLGLQSALGVPALKLIAAAMVAFVALTLMGDMTRKRRSIAAGRPSRGETLGVGAVSGLMGGMLAMPGPLAATWMSVRGFDKDAVRATILAFFVFAYGANILSYVAISGFVPGAGRLAAVLLPPLVLGVLVGSAVSRRLSETLFRRLLLGVLGCTVAMLLFSLF